MTSLQLSDARDSGHLLSLRAGAEQVQGRAGPGWQQQAQCAEPSCVGKLRAASWLSYSQPLSFYGCRKGSERMGADAAGLALGRYLNEIAENSRKAQSPGWGWQPWTPPFNWHGHLNSQLWGCLHGPAGRPPPT